MSQQEQNSENQVIQRIFLNPTEETVEENTAAENRLSAPVPVENVYSLSSSESEEIDSPLNAIYWPIPANLTQSETGLNLAQSIPTGSGTVPLTRSTPLQNDGEIVSTVATTSPIQHLLVRDESEPSPSQVQSHPQAQEEDTETRAAGRHHEISRIIDQQCLCKSCIDDLLHSENHMSFFTKKNLKHCTLCTYEDRMKEYQNICYACSRVDNICFHCGQNPVVDSKDVLYFFSLFTQAKTLEIFSNLREDKKRIIISEIFRVWDTVTCDEKHRLIRTLLNEVLKSIESTPNLYSVNPPI